MIPVCFKCKHFDRKHSFIPVFKCKAFSKRIPNSIIKYGNKHLKPYPGDHGIQFEPLVTGG